MTTLLATELSAESLAARASFPRLAAIVDRATRPIIILHDLDGVHAQWEETFVERFRSMYPHLPCADAGTRAEFNMLTGDPDYDAAIMAVMVSDGFYAELKEMPGSKEALNALDALGFVNQFCSTPTALSPTCASDKNNWLIDVYGIKWAGRMGLTHDKTLTVGDILFDDKDRITGNMPPLWTQILFTQLYNEYLTNTPRIDGWTGTAWADVLADTLEGLGF